MEDKSSNVLPPARAFTPVTMEDKSSIGRQEQRRKTRVAKEDKSSKGRQEEQRKTRVAKEDESSKGRQDWQGRTIAAKEDGKTQSTFTENLLLIPLIVVSSCMSAYHVLPASADRTVSSLWVVLDICLGVIRDIIYLNT